MRVYVVYTCDYSGEYGVEAFSTLEKANDFIKSDMQQVIGILHEDGYKTKEEHSDGGALVYVPDSGIYYGWDIFESELR